MHGVACLARLGCRLPPVGRVGRAGLLLAIRPCTLIAPLLQRESGLARPFHLSTPCVAGSIPASRTLDPWPLYAPLSLDPCRSCSAVALEPWPWTSARNRPVGRHISSATLVFISHRFGVHRRLPTHPSGRLPRRPARHCSHPCPGPHPGAKLYTEDGSMCCAMRHAGRDADGGRAFPSPREQGFTPGTGIYTTRRVFTPQNRPTHHQAPQTHHQSLRAQQCCEPAPHPPIRAAHGRTDCCASAHGGPGALPSTQRPVPSQQRPAGSAAPVHGTPSPGSSRAADAAAASRHAVASRRQAPQPPAQQAPQEAHYLRSIHHQSPPRSPAASPKEANVPRAARPSCSQGRLAALLLRHGIAACSSMVRNDSGRAPGAEAACAFTQSRTACAFTQSRTPVPSRSHARYCA